MEKTHSCCFSGHRKLEPEVERWLRIRVGQGIDYLLKRGVTSYLAGGALGFDMLAAETVLQKRLLLPDIKLVLVLPCKNQSERWGTDQKKRYEAIKKSADNVICLADQYFEGCMQQRNQYMVNQSSFCICYLTKTVGGTAYTVREAQKAGLTVYNLAYSKHSENQGLCI